MRDGKPRYVAALGTTNRPQGWRVNKRDGGVLMDITDNRVIVDGLSMPHSPRCYDGKLWVLESGRGVLFPEIIHDGDYLKTSYALPDEALKEVQLSPAPAKPDATQTDADSG